MEKKKVKKKVSKTSISEANNDLYTKIFDQLKDFELEVMESGQDDVEHNYIPFQNMALNIITGGGAIENKFLEISGDSQTGKSYLAYELMAAILNTGGHAYLNDNELAYDTAYGTRSGILDGKKYLKSKQKDIQMVFHEMRGFIKAVRQFDKKNRIICVIDSYVGLSTKVDLENEDAMKDPRGYMAMQKNMAWQNAIGNFVGYLDRYNVTLILVNQAKLDKQNSTPYFKVYNSLGEDVIKFWCTQRIRLLAGAKKKIETKSGDKKIIGQEVKVECIKNRTTPPFQKAVITILFEKGIMKYSGLEGILLADGLIEAGNKTVDGKKTKGFKVVSTGDFYTSIEDLVDENLDLVSPKNHFSINNLSGIRLNELEVEVAEHAE